MKENNYNLVRTIITKDGNNYSLIFFGIEWAKKKLLISITFMLLISRKRLLYLE